MRAIVLRSSKDPLFRAVRQLRTVEGRARADGFLIEDPRAIRVALECGRDVRHLLASEDWLAQAPAWLSESRMPVHVASSGLMRKLFPTGKTPGLVAECGQLTLPIRHLPATRRVLVLENIQDAGNLGSMLRTAEGLGIEHVVVLRSTITDLYNRVAVRASMGSLLRLHLYDATLEELREVLTAGGGQLVVTTPHTDLTLDALDVSADLAIAVGNESDGASRALLEAADLRVRIPMVTRVESLNVGAACAIALYALRAREPTTR